MSATFAYYPGCSLQSTEKEYNTSLQLVAQALDHKLEEIPDWLCCGATSAHSIDHALATALAGDTLAKAQDAGHDKILAPCAMCYSRLATTLHQIKENPAKAASLEKALQREKSGLANMRALSILDWARELSDEEILAPIKQKFNGLKVACYYGCLLVRPQKVTQVRNAEVPQGLERIVRLLGAEPVEWTMATACCGASFSLSDKPSVFRLGRRIVESALKAGAEAIIVACPMCHTNLDMRQTEFQAGGDFIPAVFITQLMGLAYGFSAKELGLDGNFVSADVLIDALKNAEDDAANTSSNKAVQKAENKTESKAEGKAEGKAES
ncbi:MAG: CoB--CoM heterodisulfide reductase iron-sulfur subunit B family protein, partial [bacterium]|nr:CoB--CoM heterodisulfide reductase iron-sulfur subunit B family protein [bacterium]